jgi:hypothetical protein
VVIRKICATNSGAYFLYILMHVIRVVCVLYKFVRIAISVNKPREIIHPMNKNKDMKTFLLRRAKGLDTGWVTGLHEQLRLRLQERCAPPRDFCSAAFSYSSAFASPGWVSREAVARAAAKAAKPRNVLGKELPSLCC